MLLECLTHRLRGHYEGDPAKYREALADEDWQEKDPVLRLQRRGVAEGWFSEDDAAAAEREARRGGRGRGRVRAREPVPAARARRGARVRVSATTYREGDQRRARTPRCAPTSA